MIKRFAPLPLAALLAACATVTDFSPEHALDMPSPTEKGYAALAAGDNPTAVRWLTVATVGKPGDPYLMLDIAAAYQRLGKFEEAKMLYQTVVDTAAGTKPDKVDDPKLQGKDLAEVAAADLAICSACDMPGSAAKGYSALAAGDGSGAVKGLADASKDKPDDLYLLIDLAAAHRRLGETDAAKKLYQAVIDKAKTPPPPAKPPDPHPSSGTTKTPPPPVKPPDPLPPTVTAHAKPLADIATDDLAQLSK
jgi:tetratricopeptide (TPR) repeat protein